MIHKGAGIIYAPIAAQVLVKLEPGESKTWTWNQKDMNGQQIPLGIYQLTINTVELRSITINFEIVGEASASSTPSVEILEEPEAWHGKPVTINEVFHGWSILENLPGPAFQGPAKDQKRLNNL